MGRLVKLLRIQRSTNTEGKALVDLGVVSEGEDTAIVDLGLSDNQSMSN